MARLGWSWFEVGLGVAIVGQIGVVFVLEGVVVGAYDCGCGKDDTVLSQWGLRRSLD